MRWRSHSCERAAGQIRQQRRVVAPHVSEGQRYSWRNATNGSTRLARSAGNPHANNAIDANSPVTVVKVKASVGVTPYSNVEISRVRPNDTASPARMPDKISGMPCPLPIATPATCSRPAPSERRSPGMEAQLFVQIAIQAPAPQQCFQPVQDRGQPFSHKSLMEAYHVGHAHGLPRCTSRRLAPRFALTC